MRIVAEAFHPGEYILDEIRERNWTVEEFAEKSGLPLTLLNSIIEEKARISPHTAECLGAILGTGAEVWANLDMHYRIWIKQGGLTRLREALQAG